VSAQDTLAERYGVASPWRRRALRVVVGAVVLTFLVWLGWVIQDRTSPEVTSELETFSVDDDHAVTAVLLVKLSGSDVRASCRLRAYAEDHTTVGELSFAPDPSKGRRQVQTIKTERRATSVESLGCTAPGQDVSR
jgi:hypothetical protein